MSVTVAELLVDTLEQIGVRHIFGIIGDSLNPIADAPEPDPMGRCAARRKEALLRGRPGEVDRATERVLR